MEKAMSQQQIKINATDVRQSFASNIQRMIDTLEQAAEAEKEFGESAVRPSIDRLERETKRLGDDKFRFLIIGDFNRGKSSILNVLLGRKDLLPVGASATTAIPTFIKYGHEEQVVVHYKNGNVHRLSVEQYKTEYTLNSKTVKDRIKRGFDNLVGKWLDPLDYADFCCPIELLSKGVEFIDTAGLNHTAAETEKTYEYIKDSHAVIFVLDAGQAVTELEQTYLSTVIKGKVNAVFFVINKWEAVDESSREEIHDSVAERLAQSLEMHEEEIRQMWDDRIFDVYAKNALDRLRSKESLDGTGFLEFTDKLNAFLINERLVSELYPSVQTAKDVANLVVGNIADLLLVLHDDLKTLEEKIRKVKPHIQVMKGIVELLDSEISHRKASSSRLVVESYKAYFLKTANSLEGDFRMPTVNSLSEKDKSAYLSKLIDLFSKYLEEKLKEWNKLFQYEVIKVQDGLIQKIQKKVGEYEFEREEIREILNENNTLSKNQVHLQTSEYESIEKAKLTEISGNALKKVFGGLAGGTVGVMSAGIGAATAANVYAGTHIVIATGLGLTPVGWALLGGSLVVGIGLAFWGRDVEFDRFRRESLQQLKTSLTKAVEDKDKLAALENHIQSLFAGFEKITQKLSDDVESLERSLDDLLTSKRQNETDYEVESRRLEDLSVNISSQWETINESYTKLAR